LGRVAVALKTQNNSNQEKKNNINFFIFLLVWFLLGLYNSFQLSAVIQTEARKPAQGRLAGNRGKAASIQGQRRLLWTR
jgi:hypothetical protein